MACWLFVPFLVSRVRWPDKPSYEALELQSWDSAAQGSVPRASNNRKPQVWAASLSLPPFCNPNLPPPEALLKDNT